MGTVLAPTAGLGSLPFRLASYPVVCYVVASFSYASDPLLFTRSLSLGTTPWVHFFSPSTVARTLRPWPWESPVPSSGSLDSTEGPGQNPHPHWWESSQKWGGKQGSTTSWCGPCPSPGEGWAGRGPQITLELEAAAWRLWVSSPSSTELSGQTAGAAASLWPFSLKSSLCPGFFWGMSRNESRHPFLLNIFPDGYTPRSSSSQEKEQKEKKLLNCCFEGGNAALAKVFPLRMWSHCRYCSWTPNR